MKLFNLFASRKSSKDAPVEESVSVAASGGCSCSSETENGGCACAEAAGSESTACLCAENPAAAPSGCACSSKSSPTAGGNGLQLKPYDPFTAQGAAPFVSEAAKPAKDNAPTEKTADSSDDAASAGSGFC
ncbi:hypothetical protein N1030_00100 [Desulfovibrio mangrovi]|uniref:hypothetical protein n=1 Tax=Desulfovibrio mangrovi TaxID=2976983 RepID=UPI002246E0D2|nr:hypothetical protein [Desulfovibrio mangrovi]UZP67410.1 hypothetical protein N1030_00100 [Desulfovibrio mangrovi]